MDAGPAARRFCATAPRSNTPSATASASNRRPRAARQAPGPAGRSLQAQFQDRHPADDRRRLALRPPSSRQSRNLKSVLFSSTAETPTRQPRFLAARPTHLACRRPRGRVRPAELAPPSAVVGLAVLVAAVSLVPLGFIVYVAVDTGWATIAALMFRPRVGELLVNTALLEVCACRWRRRSPWPRLADRAHRPAGCAPMGRLAVAPLAIPAFVQSYAWISAFPGFTACRRRC